LNGENGQLLTPTADHLFDRGFISFQDDVDLLISPVLARVHITTSVIVDRINAGDEPDEVASEYGATPAEIMGDLAYERAASDRLLH
jgi:hypothetical protein